MKKTRLVADDRKRKVLWKRAVTILAAFAVFCTTYALILPALTWEKTLICEIPEHRHTEKCYEVVTIPAKKVLICLDENHEHTDECYEIVEEEHKEKVLSCDLVEHEHTDACFDAPKAMATEYYCGKVEHVHSEGDCYFDDNSTKCTLEEHVHTLACKSNPDADVETEKQWKATFAKVSLTGNWAEDAVFIAKTQIEYTESLQNYEVLEDGETIKGYTRYGQWNGNPYEDWNVTFCNFCLHYAGITPESMPVAKTGDEWRKALKEKDLYHEIDSDYQPKTGDVVFLRLKDENAEITEPEEITKLEEDEEKVIPVGRVGFVYKFDEYGITTIEGDLDNCVNTIEHKYADKEIIGFGEIPKNPNPNAKATAAAENDAEAADEITIESEKASDGAIAIISGNLPEGATATIEAVPLSEEKLIEYFGKSKAAVMTGYVAYDITIWDGETEWQPDDTVHVVIRHPDIEVEGKDPVAVAHVDGQTDTVSNVEANVSAGGDITLDAEGFSVYIIYTVEFWYGDYMYSIMGHSDILLSELFTQLGIQEDVKDVESVEFSDPTLITVKKLKEEEDWLLSSIQPFLTEENLTVTFKDGRVFSIAVTDEYKPVGKDGELVYGKTSDTWYSNNKLRKVTSSRNAEYAYFYQTTTKVNTTYREGGENKYYIFQNGVNNASAHTYDTIEFRNAYCYPNNTAANQKTYNICIRIHLNNVPNTTVRWISNNSNQTYLNVSDDRNASPYLSVSVLSADSGTVDTLPEYSIDWEMWLEDPDTHEKIDYIPLMGGSCYIGDEYVTVYSTDDKIYTNFPTSESFAYDSQHDGWFHKANDYDSPNYYALGVVDPEGIVKGSYKTPWRTDNFACELTANLYSVPVSVKKIVEGTNPNVPDTTEYQFCAGFYDPYNNNAYKALAGYNYTKYKNDEDTTGSVGSVGTNGTFSLKKGERITIHGLEAINVPVKIEEYTDGQSYYPWLDKVLVSVDDGNAVSEPEEGTLVTSDITGNTLAIFTNILIEPVKLKVTKDVVGTTTDREFSFTASTQDGEFSLPLDNSYIVSTDHRTATFTLKDEESVELYVSKDATVTVTETGTEGFFVTFKETDKPPVSGTSDRFVMDQDTDVIVTNTVGAALPSTGGSGAYAIYALGILLVFGAIVGGWILKRRENKK